MSAVLYQYIIGNSWGYPNAYDPLHHHWHFVVGEGEWASDCGNHRQRSNHRFHGVHSISLLFDPEGDFCEECRQIYLKTEYGKEFGVQPPFRDLEGEGQGEDQPNENL